MEMPEDFRGEIEGAFFRRNDGTYTFLSYGKRKQTEGIKLCEENFGYEFVKAVEGVNNRFLEIANAFAACYLDGKEIQPNDIKLEKIIEYAYVGAIND